MDSEIIKETECIVISYTNSLINKYKENKIMRDDYVHVLLFFHEIRMLINSGVGGFFLK